MAARNVRWLLSVAICLAVAIAADRLFFGPPPPPDAIDPGGARFRAPDIVQESFGPTVAAAFPAVIIAICTVLGIFANIAYSHIRDPMARWSLRSFAPFLVSPLVIYVTYSVASAHPDGFVAALLSFQNGFFWQSIFRKSGAEGA